MKLAFEELLERGDIDPENSILSTMLATLSGIFPPGEKEFIQSVRLFIDEIDDEELLHQIQLFSTQEGHHATQHRAVNTIFEQLGYAAPKVGDMLAEEIDRLTGERSREDRLAITVVMEHFTASLAQFALRYPEHYDSLPPSMRELLFWHAIEEIEHKSVAFDVYAHCVDDPNRLRKWLLIQLVMFPIAVAQFQRMMLREQNKRPTFGEFVDTAKFLFGARGLVPQAIPQYLAMLKPGFHPWDFDDSGLVETWKLRLRSVVG